MNGTNDDPVATFTTAQTSTEDAAVVTGQLTATDIDTGDVLKYFSVGAPVDGLNIVEDTGVWTFDPTDESYQYLKEGQTLDITVEYAVEDQDGGFNESSFVITLTGTNDAPAVTGILSSLPGGSEDTLYTITKDQLLAGFSDKDTGETATLDIANLVTKDADDNVIGTLTAQDIDGNASDSVDFNGTISQWSYQPAEHYNGTVYVTYDVTDGIANTAASSTFDLAAVNDVPDLTGTKAVLDVATEDTVYLIEVSDLLTGYTDADTGETANLQVIGLSATNGFITSLNATQYQFTPNPEFNGTVDLNYVVTDNNGGNFLATNSFDVQAVNDKPVRVDGNVSTLFLIEDAPIASMGLEDLDYSVGGGTDETDSQTLSYQVSSIPDAGTRGSVYLSADVTTNGNGEPVLADGAVAVAAGQALTLDELRNLKFLAAENGSGTSTFVFTVTDTGSNDGDNTNFITETVNLDILAFNDTPVLPTDINGDLQAIVIPNATEDTVYQFTASQLLEGVIDPDIEYEVDGVTPIDNPYGDVLVVENLSVTDGTLDRS